MEPFSALLALCVGNSPASVEFPTQRPVTRIFDVFFDLRVNKRLSKQSWGWLFETLSRSLWRHRNENVWLLVQISLIFVPKGRIDNNSALVMPWHRTVDKPLLKSKLIHIHDDKFMSSLCHNGLTHLGRVLHICISKLTIIGSDNGFSPGRAPSHYLNQWWNIRNKFQWNLQQNSYIFIQEHAFENVACEMAEILPWP